MPYSIEVDLHYETVDSARKKLGQVLKTLPNDTCEVIVIHGYHGGTAIRTMVRNYKHPKVERKFIGLNGGETIFKIKK